MKNDQRSLQEVDYLCWESVSPVLVRLGKPHERRTAAVAVPGVWRRVALSGSSSTLKKRKGRVPDMVCINSLTDTDFDSKASSPYIRRGLQQ